MDSSPSRKRKILKRISFHENANRQTNPELRVISKTKNLSSGLVYFGDILNENATRKKMTQNMRAKGIFEVYFF